MRFHGQAWRHPRWLQPLQLAILAIGRVSALTFVLATFAACARYEMPENVQLAPVQSQTGVGQQLDDDDGTSTSPVPSLPWQRVRGCCIGI